MVVLLNNNVVGLIAPQVSFGSFKQTKLDPMDLSSYEKVSWMPRTLPKI